MCRKLGFWNPQSEFSDLNPFKLFKLYVVTVSIFWWLYHRLVQDIILVVTSIWIVYTLINVLSKSFNFKKCVLINWLCDYECCIEESKFKFSNLKCGFRPKLRYLPRLNNKFQIFLFLHYIKQFLHTNQEIN